MSRFENVMANPDADKSCKKTYCERKVVSWLQIVTNLKCNYLMTNFVHPDTDRSRNTLPTLTLSGLATHWPVLTLTGRGQNIIPSDLQQTAFLQAFERAKQDNRIPHQQFRAKGKHQSHGKENPLMNRENVQSRKTYRPNLSMS